MQKRPGTSIQESSPSRVTLHTSFLQKRAVITCEVSFTREVFPRRKSGVQHNPRRSHSFGIFHCWESFITSGNDGNLLKSKFSDGRLCKQAFLWTAILGLLCQLSCPVTLPQSLKTLAPNSLSQLPHHLYINVEEPFNTLASLSPDSDNLFFCPNWAPPHRASIL